MEGWKGGFDILLLIRGSIWGFPIFVFGVFWFLVVSLPQPAWEGRLKLRCGGQKTGFFRRWCWLRDGCLRPCCRVGPEKAKKKLGWVWGGFMGKRRRSERMRTLVTHRIRFVSWSGLLSLFLFGHGMGGSRYSLVFFFFFFCSLSCWDYIDTSSARSSGPHFGIQLWVLPTEKKKSWVLLLKWKAGGSGKTVYPQPTDSVVHFILIHVARWCWHHSRLSVGWALLFFSLLLFWLMARITWLRWSEKENPTNLYESLVDD